MHVALRCPCGASLKAPVKYVGRELKCPKCSAMLVVPEPPVASTSAPAEMEVLEPLEMPVTQSAIPAKPIASSPAAPVPRAPVATKPPKVKKKSTLLPYLLGLGALLIAAAGVYLVMEYRKAMPDKDKVVIKGVDGKELSRSDLEKMKSTAPPKAEPLIDNKFDSKVETLAAMADDEEKLSHVDLIKKVEPSVVRMLVTSHQGVKTIGSGFFLDTEGKICTNYHVIEGAAEVMVETEDGKKHKAIGYLTANRKLDLAIVQVNPDDFDCVPIAIASEVPDNGSDIAAFGSPKGLSFTCSGGRISSIRTTEQLDKTMPQGNFKNSFELDMTWLQHTAAISGGNSGGPIVNYKGELIGVNTWTMSEGQNLNFASSMDSVRKIFTEREKGKMRSFSPRSTPPPRPGR